MLKRQQKIKLKYEIFIVFVPMSVTKKQHCIISPLFQQILQ